MAENASVNFIQNEREPRVIKVRRLLADLPPGQKILDVGCADGAILKPLTAQHQLHGIDICQPLLDRAKANGFIPQCVDLENNSLPYKDGEFDVVFSGETIEHHVDTDWFLSEINRVLKPNGLLLLSFPNIRTITSLLMMALLDYPPMMSARYRSGHYRDFTLKTMRLALKNHHFQIEKVMGSDFYFPGIGSVGSALATVLPSWSTVVIVKATKMANSQYSVGDVTQNDIYNIHPTAG
jgi:2-polyprenyl-3-methyl-5-hydroxy-6-metoxy-1,4-benzoquinol methylase